jgi:hypothetical protein
MSSLRTAMDQELKASVVPRLRATGFAGSLPHFRRAHQSGIDLLTFQFDRNGGGFVIEISRGPVEGITTHWGKVIGPKQLTAWDMHPEERLRLQPQEGSGVEDWFRFDDGQTDACSRQVLKALHRAEEWWARHA